MKNLFNLTCVVFVLAPMASLAHAEWQVWTTTETVRVLRAAPAGKQLNVQLACAGNEWESFQILMRSDTPVHGIRLEASDLQGPSGTVLPATETRLYRQHQLHVTVATQRNDNFQPGWYPDALIPFHHPLTRKRLAPARLRAIPFDLPADETHGFWVDIHVPADTPPGLYRGTYRLAANQGQTVEIPLSVAVWGFSLPATPALKTAFGSPAQRMRGYYRERARAGKESEPSDWDEIELQCAELLARHRFNATPPLGSLVPAAQPDGTYHVPDKQITALRAFVDRYHVNALQVPRPTKVVKDPELEREKLHAWLAAWNRVAAELDRPQVVFYTYLRDEPNDEEAYRFVQKWGRAIRDAHSVVKVLVVEQTWPQTSAQGRAEWGDLYGAVDIWCPLFSLFRPESAAQRQAAGETIWTYTALCQREPTPWWHIDYPLLNYRVPAWIAWRYRIRGLLYWGGMSYWRAVDDPWTQPETYHGSGTYQHGKLGRVYNGEGSLVYPGRAVGFDGIVPSIRLKALRDAIEDYDYLTLLEQEGLAAEVEKVVLPLAGSWYRWQKDAAAYEKARVQLAAMILNAKKVQARLP